MLLLGQLGWNCFAVLPTRPIWLPVEVWSIEVISVMDYHAEMAHSPWWTVLSVTREYCSKTCSTPKKLLRCWCAWNCWNWNPQSLELLLSTFHPKDCCPFFWVDIFTCADCESSVTIRLSSGFIGYIFLSRTLTLAFLLWVSFQIKILPVLSSMRFFKK